MITTSEVEIKFNKESFDKRKYINLILKLNVNSDKDCNQLLDC